MNSVNTYLQNQWTLLLSDYSGAQEAHLQELVDLYTSKVRHYHNLLHIEALLRLVEKYESHLSNPNMVRFAVCYHDAIYNATKSDNEERSAELAEKHMKTLRIEQRDIDTCKNLILATKTHTVPEDSHSFDIEFMLGIDLSILSRPWDEYVEYTQQIRKEYHMYPGIAVQERQKKGD